MGLSPDTPEQDSDSFDDQPPPIIDYARFIAVKKQEAVLRRKVSSTSLAKDRAVEPKRLSPSPAKSMDAIAIYLHLNAPYCGMGHCLCGIGACLLPLPRGCMSDFAHLFSRFALMFKLLCEWYGCAA
jgi:hypothetical protein